MEPNVPCRRLTLVELTDDLEEVVVCDNIPQPLRNELADFVTFEGRLFQIGERRDLEDGTQGYVYYERFCLRAGRKCLSVNDYIEGVSAEEIVDALVPVETKLVN